ncbi:MAG: hypothetical protein CHACPFDD_03262 [Phycisphaerae bacterium]|nr:hypothetical protein [Phycisphaerae bacterium]
MPRPSQLDDKRRELLPVVAGVFTRLGYRRATTAELSEACGVQENILYRLWPDKKAMYLAAIDFVYEFSEQTWLRLLERDGGGASSARRLLEYESHHHGEFGHYRILFAGLPEIDDADIRAALRRTFARFHRFLLAQMLTQRSGGGGAAACPAELAAWAAIGLGTIANISRELGLLDDAQRRGLIEQIGGLLLSSGGAGRPSAGRGRRASKHTLT